MLDRDRATPYREGVEMEFDVFDQTIIFAGSLVAANDEGYAVPATDRPNYRLLGVALEQVDNTKGFSGAKRIRLRRNGAFRFNSSDLKKRTIGYPVYIVNDHTVGPPWKTDFEVRAGILVGLDGDAAWIDIGR